MAIGAKKGNALAGLNPKLEQAASKAPGAVGELRVVVALIVADHRSSGRILFLRVAQKAQRCEWNIHCEPRLDQADCPPSTTRM